MDIVSLYFTYKHQGDDMKKIAALLLIFLLFTVTFPGSDTISSEEQRENASPWPGFRRGEKNTGLSHHSTRQVDGTVLWSRLARGKINSSPAIAEDGSIYFGSDDGFIYALNPNGRTIWWFETYGVVHSSPSLDRYGNIYIGSDNDKLYSLMPNGQLNWSFDTDDIVRSSPTIGYDGTVYVGSSDGRLYAIEPDGEERWRVETGGAVTSSPAIGDDGTIYIGSGDGHIYAVEPDGMVKWRLETGGAVNSSPAIGKDGSIYIGSGDGHIYAVDPAGTVKWSFDTEGAVSSSPAIDQDGGIYFGSEDITFYALNEDGTLKWSFDTDGPIISSAALGSEGSIYFGSNDGHIYSLDEHGNLRWKTDTGEPVISSPAIGGKDRLYAPSTNGILYAFMGVPSAPENLTITVDDGELILRWNASLDKGGDDITGYRIYKGGDVDSLRWVVQVDPETRYFSDSNVDIGETYYYRLSALNAAGEGPRTDIVNATAAVLPDPPMDLEASPGDNKVELRWEPPDNDGGGEIQYYRLYREEEDEDLTYLDSVKAPAQEYIDENVTNRINYYYYVSAVNEAGEGDRTEGVRAMPTPSYSLTYCFFLPTIMIASLLILWFLHWYRRWGKKSPPRLDINYKGSKR